MNENLKSEQQLILEHMGSIVAQAKRVRPNSVTDIDDYIQEGSIALLKAIRKYDPSKNAKLNTYAWPAIWRAIARSSQKFRDVAIPLEIDIIQEDNLVRLEEYFPNLSKHEITMITLRCMGSSLEEIGEMFDKHKESIRLELEKLYKKIRKANE